MDDLVESVVSFTTLKLKGDVDGKRRILILISFLDCRFHTGKSMERWDWRLPCYKSKGITPVLAHRDCATDGTILTQALKNGSTIYFKRSM